MKRKLRRQVGDYLREIADGLELRDWTVRFIDEPTAPHALATVEIVYGRKWVDVRVHSVFLTLPPDEQRAALVHELVHCHLDAVEGVTRDAIDARAVGRRSGRLLREAQHRAIEHAVDALADVIAPRFPLPPWCR